MKNSDRRSGHGETGKAWGNPTEEGWTAESELRYSRLVRNLPAALYTCDTGGHILLYNRLAAELWGREPEIGRDKWCGSWKIYRTDGSLLQREECPMGVTLKTGKPVRNVEIIIERPDGVRRNILPYPTPVIDDSGKMVGAMNMLVDITAYNIARQDTARLAAIVSSSDDAIVSKTLEGVVTSWNKAAEKIFGYTAEEMIGESITRLFPRHRLMEETQFLESIRRGEHIDHFETKRVRKGGTLIDVSLTISPVKDSRGRIVGVSKIARDITAQKRLTNALQKSERRFKKIAAEMEDRVKAWTNELRETNRQLLRSNRELEQFTFIASHDLQEPLRKIQAFASRLSQKAAPVLTDEANVYLEKISVSARRMSLLIKNLLDFSLLAHPDANFKRVDLNKVVQEVKMDFEVLIEQKQALIRLEPLPQIEAVALQMNQLFYNLISNALKFASKERPPVIDIRSRELTEEEIASRQLNKRLSYCQITVQDNGMGFDQAHAGKVFEIFRQLSPRRSQGTGIGLALCKKITANHHGIIFAHPEKDKGCAIHLILPVKQP